MAELAPGSIVAGCRIEAVVGRGGMGVVYRATQLSLERSVALKVIAPELAGDVMFRERFKRESRIAASIEHPNVIPVYEAGEGDGVLYLTMRYVEGTDLRAVIEEEASLEPARAARLVAQVAAALAAAHRRDLMHRDVKPANVLVDPAGEREHAYLTDFGIARHVAATSGLTETGSVLGTLDYLAPERMIDGGGDARADVYAVGCVLFQSLTGSVPYPRDNEVAKMYAHLNAPVPDARELNRAVPDALAELAMRAMAKEPDERIHSARELAELLLEAADARAAGAAERDPPPIPELFATAPAPPVATEAAATEAAATEPAATESAATETAATEAAATEPVATDAAATEPAATDAAATEPAAAGPATTRAAGAGTAPPAPGRRRSRMAVAGIAGTALAVAALVVVLLSGGSDGPGSGSAGERPAGGEGSTRATQPLNPTPLEPIGLHPGADGVATGAGFVWVANRDLDTVTRVNARSRRVEGRPIQVGREPDSLALGLGAMWVTNTSDNSVTRMDPKSGRPQGTHPVGARPEGIAVAHGGVWVVNGGDGTVTRLDAQGSPTGTAPVGNAPVQLAATPDSVWVTVSKDDVIVELDRNDGQPTGRRVAINGTPRGIAFDPERGELWVSASAADRLAVVSTASMKVVRRVRVPDNPREVRFGFGGVWVTNATAQRVTAVDPARRRTVASVPIQGTTYGLAVGEGLAWAASESDGLLLPIRPR